MKKIELVKITVVNFMPFAEEIFEFPKHYGFRMITGTNKEEPNLGANGVGKSSLWEALCFVLYGTGAKGKKLSGLLTWGEKDLQVTLELLINDNTWTIKRSGPPMRLSINGKPAEQKDVDSLVNLSKDRFLHSVLFGQGAKLFPDLDSAARIDLFDEVLDLSVWTKCLEKATAKCSDVEKDIAKLKIDLAHIDGKLSALETENAIQMKISMWELNHQNDIDRAVANIEAWEYSNRQIIDSINKNIAQWNADVLTNAEGFAKEIDRLTKKKEEIEAKPDLLEEMDALGQAIGEADKLIKEKTTEKGKQQYEVDRAVREENLWMNNACPSCGRAITDKEKKEKLATLAITKESSRLRIESLSLEIKNIETKRKQDWTRFDQISREIAKDETEICQIDTDILKLQREGEYQLKLYDEGKCPYQVQLDIQSSLVNPHIAEKQRVETAVNPFIERAEFVQKERVALLIARQNVTNTQQELDKKLIAATYWKTGFKRIRLFFVQQILDALQIEIKAAMAGLGLEGWNIKLSTESETKSGTMKLGVQIHVSSRTADAPWEAWSGGESQRLRLAIAQGLGSLIQRAAGVWWGLEVWDEPTNWLSEKGIEDLLEALSFRADSQRKQVWLVDHRALTFSGFTEIWSIVKDQKGSKICLTS